MHSQGRKLLNALARASQTSAHTSSEPQQAVTTQQKKGPSKPVRQSLKSLQTSKVLQQRSQNISATEQKQLRKVNGEVQQQLSQNVAVQKRKQPLKINIEVQQQRIQRQAKEHVKPSTLKVKQPSIKSLGQVMEQNNQPPCLKPHLNSDKSLEQVQGDPSQILSSKQELLSSSSKVNEPASPLSAQNTSILQGYDSDEVFFTASEKKLLNPDWLKSTRQQDPWSSDSEDVPTIITNRSQLVNYSSTSLSSAVSNTTPQTLPKNKNKREASPTQHPAFKVKRRLYERCDDDNSTDTEGHTNQETTMPPSSICQILSLPNTIIAKESGTQKPEGLITTSPVGTDGVNFTVLEITPDQPISPAVTEQRERQHHRHQFSPDHRTNPGPKKRLFGTDPIPEDVLLIPLNEEINFNNVLTATVGEGNLSGDHFSKEQTPELSLFPLQEIEFLNMQSFNVTTTEEIIETAQDRLSGMGLDEHDAADQLDNNFVATEEIDLHLEQEVNVGNEENEPASRPKRKRNNVESEEPLTRKRKLNPSAWKASKAKLANNSGIAHVSLRGKVRDARKIKPGCDSTKCKKQCHNYISYESRKALFDKYWGLQDKVLQWHFLSKLIRTEQVKRRVVVGLDEEEQFYRNNTHLYFLPDSQNNKFNVCQKMFVDTFDVSVRVVRTAMSKNSPDKRGKHPHHRKLSPDLLEGVKSHIKSFPMVDSHYCRADSTRKYLDEHLNVAKMHRLYLMGKNIKDLDVASQRQYRDIFNTYFNLSFFKPKKDQCSECAEWKSSEENAAKYQLHQDSKNFVRALKKQDKEESRDKSNEKNVRVLTCDLEKVLYCPQSEMGEFYYKRKLSVYNFTIFDCTVKDGHLYVWDQTTGKRGSDETSSFLQHYIESVVNDKQIDTIIIYSDSCSGQNKNQFLFTMYYALAMRLKINIIHRYLEKGHTQMECDSVHARVEKKIKKQEVFVPSQYYGFMKTAKVKKPVYKVHEVKLNEIYNYRELAKHLQWSKIPISKLREICFKPSGGVISYRVEWANPAREASILVKRVGRQVKWETVKPVRSYNAKVPLKAKLVNDLAWYVKKGHIPPQFVPQYKEWTEIARPAEDDEEEDDVPSEIVPPAAVVHGLMTTEYEDIEMENADPFNINDNQDDDNNEEERSEYNDSDVDDSDDE